MSTNSALNGCAISTAFTESRVSYVPPQPVALELSRGYDGAAMEALASVLIMLGLLAIAFDLHVTMHGLLAAVGTAAVALGMAWLVWLALPPIVALTVAALIGAAALRVSRPIFRAMRELLERAPQPEFVSAMARAVEDLRPVGLVRIDGMLWRAVSVAGPAERGQAVRVIARRELSLMVSPVSAQEAAWQPTTL